MDAGCGKGEGGWPHPCALCRSVGEGTLFHGDGGCGIGGVQQPGQKTGTCIISQWRQRRRRSNPPRWSPTTGPCLLGRRKPALLREGAVVRCVVRGCGALHLGASYRIGRLDTHSAALHPSSSSMGSGSIDVSLSSLQKACVAYRPSLLKSLRHCHYQHRRVLIVLGGASLDPALWHIGLHLASHLTLVVSSEELRRRAELDMIQHLQPPSPVITAADCDRVPTPWRAVVHRLCSP